MTSPEMSDRSPEDWLPPGWSVSVRVRRSGKKDKHYHAPSGLRFNSKVEVTRYLKTLDGDSAQPTVEKHAFSDGAPEPGKEDKLGIKESVENHSCREIERSSSGSGEKCNAGLEKSINSAFSLVQDKENTMIEENVKGPAASLECKDHKNVNAQESEKNAFDQIKQIGSLEGIKTSPKHAPNVVVERVVAEGLPAGWIKEVKLTKKKNTVRRDPYYIDPLSGYIFRSMKDVLRYLATGDIGRLAYKPKEESPIVELENDRSSSPSEAKRQKLQNSGVEGTEDKSSEQQVPHLTDDPMLESVHKEATAPPPDNSKPEPDQFNSSDEQRHDCGTRTNCLPDSETEVPQDKKPSMGGSASKTPKTKSRKKKSSDLPRRTSSRLAGVVADPKVQVTTTPQVKDEELSSGPQKKRVKRGKTMSKSINELCAPVEDKPEKTQIGDEKEKETKEEQKKVVAADNVVPKEEELALPFELPSGDILSDPCIEFAIKTLTGVSFDTCTAIKSCSTSAEQPNSVLPSKVNEAVSLSLNPPFGDSWQDPCIEFAIKTLTGAIPVDFDSDIPDLMRQQMNSSQIQERTESNVGMDNNFCRTDMLWQHSEAAADSNGFGKQSGVGPASQPRNIDLQRPSGSIR